MKSRSTDTQSAAGPVFDVEKLDRLLEEAGLDAVLVTSNAVKAQFGEDWESSFLPPGYEDLIDECSVRHFDLNSGWHVQNLSDG